MLAMGYSTYWLALGVGVLSFSKEQFTFHKWSSMTVAFSETTAMKG